MPTKKKTTNLRAVTDKHLFRNVNDKPTDDELTTLKKAVYYAIKMVFDADPTGESKILFEGKPVKGKGDKVELMDLYSKIINTYGTM